jgi:diadenosine tetraphosphate (Ap4A) HIT family hydrolase
MRQECLFCDSYIKNKRQDLIIFENTNAYSILNYKPSVPGHSLVIPKKHVTNLKNLTGNILEDLIQAIPETFGKLLEIFDFRPELISDYYKSLIYEPPEPESKEFAQFMLEHPFLYNRPISYNWGMNYGYNAGQREKHLHIHLFPRSESGLGIATAMRKLLQIDEK